MGRRPNNRSYCLSLQFQISVSMHYSHPCLIIQFIFGYINFIQLSILKLQFQHIIYGFCSLRLTGCCPVYFLFFMLFFPSFDVFPEIFDPSSFSLYFSSLGLSPTLISPVSHYTYPNGWCGSSQPYRRGRTGSRKQRLMPTRVTDSLNRTLKTCLIDDSPYNNLTPIPTLKLLLPTLLNSNTRSIVHKMDEMTNIIDDNEVDIACVTETWLSDEVTHCVTNIDGYTCERRDKVDRRGGGVLTYIRNSIPYHRSSILECDKVE